MDKFPLLWESSTAGVLKVEQEPLYTWFDAHCSLPGEGLWCAWIIGENSSLRLGVLEPSGQEAVIQRRFSRRMTAPLGKLLRGEVRPAAAERREDWEAVPDPENLFRAPWLRKRLRGAEGALFQPEKERKCLALPYDRKRPFPLPTLFCFATVRSVGGEKYAVFAFDKEEQPVFL